MLEIDRDQIHSFIHSSFIYSFFHASIHSLAHQCSPAMPELSTRSGGMRRGDFTPALPRQGILSENNTGITDKALLLALH